MSTFASNFLRFFGGLQDSHKIVAGQTHDDFSGSVVVNSAIHRWGKWLKIILPPGIIHFSMEQTIMHDRRVVFPWQPFWVACVDRSTVARHICGCYTTFLRFVRLPLSWRAGSYAALNIFRPDTARHVRLLYNHPSAVLRLLWGSQYIGNQSMTKLVIGFQILHLNFSKFCLWPTFKPKMSNVPHIIYFLCRQTFAR